MLNDASVKLGIPVVHGSIFRFEGQVTVFDPTQRSDLSRHAARTPAAGAGPSCAEAGVLGVLPGIIGSIQALEAIKLILDLGDSLVGPLLAFDALEMAFREFKLSNDPANEMTWDNRELIKVVELEDHCQPAALGRSLRSGADGPNQLLR